MTLAEYQLNTKRTNVDLGSTMLNNIHMVLGLTSELSELCEALVNADQVNVGEELADQMWYASEYCNINGFDLELLLAMQPTVRVDADEDYDYAQESLVNSISELANLHKRELAYKKAPSYAVQKQLICNIVWCITEVMDHQTIDCDRVLQNNIDKLKARYPNAFSEFDALNRNLAQERIELEK